MQHHVPGLIRGLLLDKLGNTLTLGERRHIQTGINEAFLRERLDTSMRSERRAMGWLLGALVVTTTVIVTWGMSHGWQSVWSYLISAAILSGGYIAARHYAEAVRVRTIWEMAAGLATSGAGLDAVEPGAVVA